MLPHHGVWWDQVRPAATIPPSREDNLSGRPPISFMQHALGNLHLATQPLHPEEHRCSRRTACSSLNRQNTTQEESLRGGDAISSRVWRQGSRVPSVSQTFTYLCFRQEIPNLNLGIIQVLMANRHHLWGSLISREGAGVQKVPTGRPKQTRGRVWDVWKDLVKDIQETAAVKNPHDTLPNLIPHQGLRLPAFPCLT